MTTIVDVTNYLSNWYRELWCETTWYTCGYCKYEDICTIYCHALANVRKTGEYH